MLHLKFEVSVYTLGSMIKEKVSLFYRQKVLLALMQAFGGRVPSVDFQKYLFLFTTLCQKEKSYEFVPYKFGCFSFQSYADRRRLIDIGAITSSDIWDLGENSEDYISMLKREDQSKLKLFAEKYSGIGGNELIKEVYVRYPYYAIQSEIADKLMSADELLAIQAMRPTQQDTCLFTIGYEGNSFEHYINRLIKNNVQLLCDVRKNPLSRKYGFSKKTLSETLKKIGIEYHHIPDLGIVSEKRQELKCQSDYDRLFDDYEKTVLRKNETALTELFDLVIERKRVAITCFEAEHCMCHRSRVAKAIQGWPDWSFDIQHI